MPKFNAEIPYVLWVKVPEIEADDEEDAVDQAIERSKVEALIGFRSVGVVDRDCTIEVNCEYPLESDRIQPTVNREPG